MSLFEVVFKARHKCEFGNLSRRLPSAKIFVWCNRKHEVIEIVLSDSSEYKFVREALRKLVGILDETFNEDNVCFVTKKCNCTVRNSIAANLEANKLLHLMPVVYEAGWEHYHAIAFRHRDFRRFMEAAERLHAEIVLLRKSALSAGIATLMPVAVGNLFADMTGKQLEALLTSYDMGYFKFPRKMNVKDIARARRTARTTFQEHLTKAENKLVSNLLPYLTLFEAKSQYNSTRSRQRTPLNATPMAVTMVKSTIK